MDVSCYFSHIKSLISWHYIIITLFLQFCYKAERASIGWQRQNALQLASYSLSLPTILSAVGMSSSIVLADNVTNMSLKANYFSIYIYIYIIICTNYIHFFFLTLLYSIYAYGISHFEINKDIVNKPQRGRCNVGPKPN